MVWGSRWSQRRHCHAINGFCRRESSEGVGGGDNDGYNNGEGDNDGIQVKVLVVPRQGISMTSTPEYLGLRPDDF